MIALARYYDMQISVNIVYFQTKFNLKIFLVGTKKKYVQFHNINIKMPEFQLLIGLETSFKN